MIAQSLSQLSGKFGESIDLLASTALVWMPFLFSFVLFQTWIMYSRAKFIHAQGSVLLEIKLPQEILQSPAAMELVFVQLWQARDPTYIEGYIKGEVRNWFSVELVSIGGTIHFFVWTAKTFQRLVETSIYAQYPTVEIYEAEDYAAKVYHDPEHFIYWFTYFKLTGKDAYPIKTYIDYGLDKNPEEEYKIDPLTSLLEYLGSLKKGEQTWIQILIQAHRKTSWRDITLPKDDWRKQIKDEIKKIIKEAQPEGTDKPSMLNLTEDKKDIINALERSMGKFAFETIIRGYYLAEKDAFKSVAIPGLIGCLRQFSASNRNGFRLGKFSAFRYPWQDFRNLMKRIIERRMLDSYKRRSFFNPPNKHYRATPYILTTEELATLFHFPGKIAATPTVERIPSKKGAAPTNLPI
ncbi:MAG: hypothetical protein AAB587_01005 [Patescibacteria group bacterium]